MDIIFPDTYYKLQISIKYDHMITPLSFTPYRKKPSSFSVRFSGLASGKMLYIVSEDLDDIKRFYETYKKVDHSWWNDSTLWFNWIKG